MPLPDPMDAPVIIPIPVEVPEEVVDENVEFVVVEEMPMFRDGTADLMKYLVKTSNILLSVPSREFKEGLWYSLLWVFMARS